MRRALHLSRVSGSAPVTEVRINRTRIPLSLVLSSYVRTQWRLVLAQGVLLEQVVLNGAIESALVEIPEGIDLFDQTGDQALTACAFSWPDDNLGCETQQLVHRAEELTGLTLTSFQGCYDGIAFEIGGVEPQ